MRCSVLARFSPVLSLLIEGRVPLDEALILAGDASGDVVIREDCGKLAASIRAGKTLEEAASETKRFPASFVRALIWERYRDGFPEVLRSMSDMYAGRARALMALLVAVMPVLVVLFVGLSVGVVVVSLFMPLIELLRKLA
jgi:type IV pilus assembly protein PilC